jgi:biopolymer transport protein ExbB
MHSELSFILAGGPVSISVAIILVVMSLLSWFVIIERSINLLRERYAQKAFIAEYAACHSLAAIHQIEAATAMAELAKKALLAAEQADKNANLATADRADFVAKVANRIISDQSQADQRGLSLLASVGSIAPFVGLFGTVWGIYHALESISVSGQATLDKVAGPVGEALIMTAVGLAVAIPAVLAYNALVKANLNNQHRLTRFAEEIHSLLTTGASLNVSNPEQTSASIASLARPR